MNKKNHDPTVPWFHAAEALNEFVGIRFGRIAPGQSEPEWIFLSHAEFDGIGGFADILRKRGARVGPLPETKHPKPPSILPMLRTLPKFFLPRRRPEWKPFPSKTASHSSMPPIAVAWHVFDATATAHIRQASRRLGVTVNSFLLHHLTAAVRPFLKDPSAKVPWAIPVNLRGKVRGLGETSNHSSTMDILIEPGETITSLHKKIHDGLQRGDYWSLWRSCELARSCSQAMKKYLLATELTMPQLNIGAFSNLGEWDADQQIAQPGCAGAWLFCPPVLRSVVVGAGCMTFQNQLSLTIHAHPELTDDPSTTHAWIGTWVDNINADLAAR